MVVVERPIRFEEVDAAGILFFPRFAAYAHEGMERLFDGLEGGYVRLITARKVGLPVVALTAEFTAPLVYGDVARIHTSVTHIGRRSAALSHRIVRARDGAAAALLRHTVVTTDLSRMTSCDMPTDVRAALAQHLEAAARE
jgi:4-hydroxybenzoyl-CoA thioesterase